MQYIIMITIVLGLALSDIVTGWIKAHINNDYCSRIMRKGGLNKLCEIIVMLTACGLEIGIKYLGVYYDSNALAAITGAITAISVFVYITIMELISILENYAEINPDTAWAKEIIKKLRSYKGDDKNGD